jgi:Tfp pilus assembly protein PilF
MEEDKGSQIATALTDALRAADLLDAGDARGALILAGAVRQSAPGFAEAHYVYGQACAAMGDHPEAQRAFVEAIRIKPGWADAWINYGLACYAQGGVEAAKAAMRRALDAQPGHPAATANLGALLRITGHHETSETLLRAALAGNPNNVGVRLNLVAELLSDERPGDALALLDDGNPPKDPATARHWHLQRIMALVGLGRPAEARDVLSAFEALGPVPAALAPLWRWRRTMLAVAEGHDVEAEAEADAMADVLAEAGSAALLEHRIMAHYDLAKFWSGRGATSKAFAQWVAGHDLLKTVQPFSRKAAAAFDAAAIAAFPPGRFTTASPRASNADAAPVFIVGMPRSGTTLCEQILAAHRDVHGAGERLALGQLFHRLAGEETAGGVARVAALPPEALDAAATSYLAELHALAPDKARVVDKMPGNYRLAWLIALLFPGARIIHCTRDPRDIGLSIFTFRFHGEHGYAHDLRDLGWTIAQQERLMAHWTAVLPDAVLTLRLDDWVADFDGTLARVLAHLGLPPDPNCARFHKAEGRVRTVSRAQVRQPVNGRGLGRWRAYAAELGPLIDALAEHGSTGPPPPRENSRNS